MVIYTDVFHETFKKIHIILVKWRLHCEVSSDKPSISPPESELTRVLRVLAGKYWHALYHLSFSERVFLHEKLVAEKAIERQRVVHEFQNRNSYSRLYILHSRKFHSRALNQAFTKTYLYQSQNSNSITILEFFDYYFGFQAIFKIGLLESFELTRVCPKRNKINS